TVHDLQHRRLPQFFSLGRRMLRDWLYRRAAGTGDGIVCETEYVKNDIVDCYGVSIERIHVVPCPPPRYVLNASVDDSTLETVRAKYRIPHGYIFYPAQFWRHKNHLVLVDSLAHLKDVLGV